MARLLLGLGLSQKSQSQESRAGFLGAEFIFSAALAVQLKSRGSINLGGDEELAQLFFSASFGKSDAKPAFLRFPSFASSGAPVLESVSARTYGQMLRSAKADFLQY